MCSPGTFAPCSNSARAVRSGRSQQTPLRISSGSMLAAACRPGLAGNHRPHSTAAIPGDLSRPQPPPRDRDPLLKERLPQVSKRRVRGERGHPQSCSPAAVRAMRTPPQSGAAY